MERGFVGNRRKRHPFKRQPVFVPNGVHLLVGHDAATRLPQLQPAPRDHHRIVRALSTPHSPRSHARQRRNQHLHLVFLPEGL